MREVLLVEDDLSLGQALQEQLQKLQLAVCWVKCKADALLQLRRMHFDLCVLDIGLPDGSGLDLAREIKLEVETPFLFLTAMNSAQNRLEAFELGADQFIPKPFFLREFILRVQKILGLASLKTTLAVGKTLISFDECSIKLPDGTIEFPNVRDMKLLKILVESAPGVLTRSDLINKAWGNVSASLRSVDNSVVRLRQILQRGEADQIRSVRGLGYQWLV